MYKKFGCLAASSGGTEFREAVRSRSRVSFYVFTVWTFCFPPAAVHAHKMSPPSEGTAEDRTRFYTLQILWLIFSLINGRNHDSITSRHRVPRGCAL